MLYYARATNELYFLNNAGTAWSSPVAPGTAVTLSNSQCSVNVAGASVTVSGTNLTLNLPMTFTAAYAGAKNTYMYAAGSSADSGWQTLGSWTVPATSEVVSDVSVTPSGGTGLQQTFALEYADSLGATDLASVWVWFTSNYNTVSAPNSCMLYYARATNELYFLNNAGTTWSAPAAPGTAVTLSNSQCSINVAAASVTVSGTNLTLNLPMTFTAAYAGAKNTYMYAAGSSADSGWQALGSWTVPATSEVASVVSVTPSSGTGLQQTTFALQYADSLGATDLASVWVWFTSNFNLASAPNSCMVYYARATNLLYFLNDAGTAWSSPAAPGAAVTLSNSQCSVDVAAASVTVSGTNLTLNLPVTFMAAYAGTKSTYMYAAGSSANSGWQALGSWTP
jgi:phage baseplate assembly protein gpV